jgi:WS/DGAT/MGAT family acyltransferase
MEDFLDMLRDRLHLTPRYRQKLAFPPASSARPLWVDDPDFNLEYHVRHTALPAPGSEEQLRNLVSRIFSQQLDRSKPLWELWIVEGYEDGQWAMITKTHHALIDGSRRRRPRDGDVRHHAGAPRGRAPRPPVAARTASPRRSTCSPAAARPGPRGRADRRAHGRDRRAPAALARAPRARRSRAWARSRGRRSTRRRRCRSTSRSGRTGGSSACAGRLEDFKLVKDVYGGTVNDVVLTAVTGALREWLRARGVRTEGLELRALVPVSVRQDHEHQQLGNRIAAMRGPLPVYIADPLERLRAVRAGMDGLKDSKQALGAEVLAGMQNFAPPTILGAASRLNFSTRLFNLLVTNVPARSSRSTSRARDAVGLPGRVPAQGARAGDRDHLLQRLSELRAARRLRRAARPRGPRRDARLVDRRAHRLAREERSRRRPAEPATFRTEPAL